MIRAQYRSLINLSNVQGAHFPHLQQLSSLFPNPQLLHKLAGILLFPIHLSHLQQLSFLFPKPQSPQSLAGILVFPIHLSHLQQLSFLFPKPQLLHKFAGYFPIRYVLIQNAKSIIIRVIRFTLLLYFSTMNKNPRKSNNKNNGKSFSKPRKDRMIDISRQDGLIFNRTPILSSALQKLKKDDAKGKLSRPKESIKRNNQYATGILPEDQIKKKVKKDSPIEEIQGMANVSGFTYSALQRDLYNFYTLNKQTIKNLQAIPQPKFQVGALVLTAISDRGIGGKYIVTNFFRNKKGYIDYKQLSQSHDTQAIQAYRYPGDYVMATVTRGNNPKSIQLSLAQFIEVDQKSMRVGQCLPAQVKSKQQTGCHLTVKNCKKYKFFLSKNDVVDSEEDEEAKQFYDNVIEEKKQLLVCVKQVNETTKIVKVVPCCSSSSVSEKSKSYEAIFINMKGVQEEEMSRLDLDQFVTPGTLVNSKIIKILRNGVIVKFLKIFLGYIHMDHLQKPLNSYLNDQKLQARIIYSCVSPPALFLSERHVNLSIYEPERQLYQPLKKPNMSQQQGSYFNIKEEAYIHPIQLHTQIDNVEKLWVKENNYFERYQIMCSKKLGLRVGQISKIVPFNNFKVYGDGSTRDTAKLVQAESGKNAQQIMSKANNDSNTGKKFRVMCLDVWNKVVKISYDPKIIKAEKESLLFDLEEVDEKQKYIGFINGVNTNGVIVQFCNNIRGVISKNELKANQIQIDQTSIGQGFQAYVSNVKKGLSSLSLVPPNLRKKKEQKKGLKKKGVQAVQMDADQLMFGTIQSVNTKSIHPIYVKLKSKIVKISIFTGIMPASISALETLRNLNQNFEVGQKIKVFKKGKQYTLYPPQQLSDKGLRICRAIKIQGSNLRLQTAKDKFRNCHITDITDLIVPFPFTQVQIGQYYIGRQLQDGFNKSSMGNICLRDSIVKYGIPANMKEYKEKFESKGQFQSIGDYRNRLLTLGSASLSVGDVIFGYVKAYTERGCFISLSKDYEVRIQKCELSDQFITVNDKSKFFKMNTLVLLRLISEKVRPNQPNKKLFDASSRQSVVKHGYPLNDQTLMSGITVSGVVSGYVKGKALVKIESSKETGIIAPHDIQGADNDTPLEKLLPIGTHLKCKITQYQHQSENDRGKKLIRLSTLKKYFDKFKGIELMDALDEKDERVQNLWQSYEEMLKVEAPVQQNEIMVAEQQQDEEQEDQYARINRLLGAQKNGQMQVQEESEDQEQEQEQEAMEVQEQVSAQQDGQKEIQDQKDQDQQEEEQEQGQYQLKKKQQAKNFKKVISQFEKMPHTPQFYHSLLLANPTPESYLMYISSLLPTSTPDQIRSQFKRAINFLSKLNDKDNMWISWLNMEAILGGFQETVKKAMEGGVGMEVHFRIAQILMEQEKWNIGLEFAKKMLKKFNKESKAYSQFIKIVLMYGRQNGIPERLTPEQIIKRARQCLKLNDCITIESKYAKTLYEMNQNQKARNVFEGLITKYPKRTDLWSMYTDLQVKHCDGQIDKARNLMERALSLGLKKKKLITILKKYHQMEVTYGTQQNAQKILERAKVLADNLQGRQVQQDDDQDISD